MFKAEFIERTKRAWAEWDSLLDLIMPEADGVTASLEDWSIKDLIAHLTWYEREMVDMLKRRDFSGSDWWNLSSDERNMKIRSVNQDTTLEEVQREAQKTRHELLSLLESLSDEDLVNPESFPGMPLDWTPMQVIDHNVSEHYSEHAAQLRDWLSQED